VHETPSTHPGISTAEKLLIEETTSKYTDTTGDKVGKTSVASIGNTVIVS
jgi:hypothetical protein